MAENSEVDDCNVSYSLDYFVDYEVVTTLIDDAKNYYLHPISIEESLETLKRIMDKYVDQPHLIDPYLDRILSQILDIIKNKDVPYDLKQLVTQYLYKIINMRGHKHIVRYLPHEVGDLEISLKLLEEANNRETRWEMLYFLILWMSVIVMIPFDMIRLESKVAQISDQKSIAERILDICKIFICDMTTNQEVAAYLCARFVSRIDMKKLYLSDVINWLCNAVIKESKSVTWRKFGSLSTLALILKHGKREDLQPFAQQIFDCIIEANCLQNKFRLTRKYGIKIIQRVGLTCLRIRIATWRYNRGSRSLVTILSSKNDDNHYLIDNHNADINKDVEFESANEDIPQLVVEVMAYLLEALRDTDIIVRWPAAKGVGRITDRLTSEFGDDVVDNVLTLFSPRESSCAWNGGCLTLAELGRRGLLLPKRLPQVVDVLIKALVYEAPLKSITAGNAVRDAACYTTWSLARAYDPNILKPYVDKISSNVLIVVAFDREVTCRRAASATFQEHVGRQGTFPHGIEIVSISDYFSVGGTSNAYLNIGVNIARYPEYTRTMIDHLFNRKIRHWDAVIRDLASKTLHKMTAIDPAYMMSTLDKILLLTEDVDIQTRHGALLSVGEIVHALAEIPDSSVQLSDELIGKISGIIPRYYELGQFRGVGGDVNKEASCFVIMKCSLGKLPVASNVIECWQRLINECLPYESSKVRTAATEALNALSEQYYVSDAIRRSSFMEQLDTYFKQVAQNNENSRLGYALALGSLSPVLLEGHLDTVISYLIDNTMVTRENMLSTPVRKQAIESLVSIWKKFCIDTDDYADKCLHYTLPLLNTFLEGLSDYTIDKRGDIGSMVREASMKAIQIIITSDSSKIKDIITPGLIENILSALAKQAVERISRVRVIAVSVFVDVLFSDIPQISHAAEIKQIFQTKSNEWHSESAIFNMFVPLVKYPVFLAPVLSGIIKTIGGITESLVKASSSALTTYLNASPVQDVEALCVGIVEEFKSSAGNDTKVKSLLLFLQKFLAYPCLKPILSNTRNTFAEDIYNLTSKEISRTKDYKKLSLTVDVYCQLIQVRGTVSKKCLGKLCALLCHRFTWLRKIVALNLSEAIMMYSDKCDVSPEKEEEITELLTSFNWHDCSVEEAKAVVDTLVALLNISTAENGKTTGG